MKVIAIAAIGNDRQIGLLGKLPWHNPDDLRWYRNCVEGHSIVCGRKTYEGLPRWAKESCDIAVVSSENQDHPTFSTVQEALFYFEGVHDTVWICGGSSIYEYCLENNLIDELYLTKINYSGYADTFFPEYHNWIRDYGCNEEAENLGSCIVYKYKKTTDTVIRHPRTSINGMTPTSAYLDELVSPLTYRAEEPDNPRLGDAYIDVENNCMMLYTHNGWMPVEAGYALNNGHELAAVHTTIEADPEAQRHTEIPQGDIRDALEGTLENFIGENNTEDVRNRIRDALERQIALMYNQDVNSVETSVEETEDGIILDVFVPDSGISYQMQYSIL